MEGDSWFPSFTREPIHFPEGPQDVSHPELGSSFGLGSQTHRKARYPAKQGEAEDLIFRAGQGRTDTERIPYVGKCPAEKEPESERFTFRMPLCGPSKANDTSRPEESARNKETTARFRVLLFLLV